MFTSSIKRQLIGHFHVLVVQKQEINLPKKNVMHVQSCFLLIKLLVFVVFFFLTFSLPSALLDLKIPNGTWTERSAILDFSFVALIPCEGYD